MVIDTDGNIVIGGSGPSLTCIDYTRLPKTFDIFRLNNFFFEKKYYLGKRVTHYFTDYGFIKNQFFNLWNLSERKEYFIKNIFSNGNLESYPTVGNLETIVSQEKKFLEFIFFYKTYYNVLVSGGIFSLFGAIAMGYKNIYLTGIDFYRNTKKIYPWDLGEKYRSANPRDDSEEKALSVINLCHPEDVQIKALLLAKDVLMHKGGNIYSISLDSKVNEYVEMAPVQHASDMHVEDKGENAMLDWMELPQSSNVMQTENDNDLSEENIAVKEHRYIILDKEENKNEIIKNEIEKIEKIVNDMEYSMYLLKNKPSCIEFYRIRLMKYITFGMMKKHYIEKYNKYKNILEYIKIKFNTMERV